MKPWFQYTFIGGFLRFWWPCHWLGVLVMVGSMVTPFAVFLAVRALFPHQLVVGFLLAIACTVPWGVWGARHSEEWHR